ncbi:AIM24 family protein [Halobacterium bonnevillei]|uniref:Uncharacterized protein n=1 Tax=Halobacterium bonnevillei TaxID=2692200 RepID=A0A6B0SQP5_9EURY|nr:AIM24 family protein [Halobacterium bonnevillei]MXR21871.1 hypothetical protein [Halobacterium bonnevillei]
MDATAEDGHGGLVVANLVAGESVLAASGALVDHTGNVRVERARDVVFRSVANAAGQRQRTPVRVTADAEATVRFAPPHHGSVVAVPLEGDGIAATRDAFVATDSGVRVGADRVGERRRAAAALPCDARGHGTAYVAGRGRVDQVRVPEGDSHVVSAAHVVAFDANGSISVERSSAIEDTPPACRFRGPTTVWVATRPSPRFTQ